MGNRSGDYKQKDFINNFSCSYKTKFEINK